MGLSACNDDERARAWGGLAEIGTGGPVGQLEAILLNGDVELRALAARALGKSREATAIPALQAAIRDRNPIVRAEAVAALRSLGAD